MKSFRKILIFVITAGFLVSGVQITVRILAEQRNRNVELVADLKDFEDMAADMNTPIEEIAKKLTGSGVTSIAVSEENLENMEKDGEVLIHSSVDLKHINVNFNNEYNKLATQVRNYIEESGINYGKSTVIFTDNQDTYNFLNSSFNDRLKGLTESFFDEGKFAVLIKKEENKIKKTGLGLTDDDFEFAKTLGFNDIIPRIENHEGITTDEVDRLYSQLKKYKVKTIVFAGVTVFGQNYQDEDNEILKYIGEKFSQEGSEVITAIIEKPVETDLETAQRGIKALAKASKYVNTKVYSIDATQLTRITASGMVEQWTRAVSQRNVRVIYIRPLNRTEKTITENFEETIDAIKEMKSRVKYMGMRTDSAKGLGNIKQNNFLQLIMILGVISSGFLLLIILFNCEKIKKILYFLYGVVMACSGAVYCIPGIYSVIGGLSGKVFAFCASVIFPSLAGMYIIYIFNGEIKKENEKISKIIYRSILLLIVTALIAGIGGVYIGALLSGSQYVLKLDVFRGVKLSFILPVLIFGLGYVMKCGLYCDSEGKPLGIVKQAEKLLNSMITVKYAIAVLVVVLGLALVVMRSGNTLISSASSIELSIRNFLEKYLVARPRTKELVAFPVLMFIIYTARYKLKELGLFAMAVAMIGIEDIINSFCHIRMPVLITTLSVIYSLIFAVIIGSIGIAVIEKIVCKFKK